MLLLGYHANANMIGKHAKLILPESGHRENQENAHINAMFARCVLHAWLSRVEDERTVQEKNKEKWCSSEEVKTSPTEMTDMFIIKGHSQHSEWYQDVITYSQ